MAIGADNVKPIYITKFTNKPTLHHGYKFSLFAKVAEVCNFGSLN